MLWQCSEKPNQSLSQALPILVLGYVANSCNYHIGRFTFEDKIELMHALKFVKLTSPVAYQSSKYNYTDLATYPLKIAKSSLYGHD